MNAQVSAEIAGRSGGANEAMVQYSTFLVAGRLYGIDVTRVQEVVRPMPMTTVPLADTYVKGLINLRGQVATAIGLRELFGLESHDRSDLMNVVCHQEGNLISLQVDEIGDVVEVSTSSFEATPQTLPDNVRRFMSGVFKTEGALLSIIDIDRISGFLNE